MGAAVVNLVEADVAVEKQKAVVVVVDGRLQVMVTAGVRCDGNSLIVDYFLAGIRWADCDRERHRAVLRIDRSIGASRLVDLSIQNQFLHIRQNLDHPAQMNSLRFVADRAF